VDARFVENSVKVAASFSFVERERCRWDTFRGDLEASPELFGKLPDREADNLETIIDGVGHARDASLCV
jgi:hypothetical protein